MQFKRACGSSVITLEAVQMGLDLCVCIFGGDAPHIGAVTLSIPRESLKGPSTVSATTSVLAVSGHKEDELARKAGTMLAARLNCRVAVCCGIHLDNAAPADIAAIENTVLELVRDFADACLSQ
jgi:hypothetical protein